MSHHQCAARGCTEQIGIRFLMCPTHWRQVPKPLQNQLYIVWGWYQKGRASIDQLRAAQTACVAAIAPPPATLFDKPVEGGGS